MIKILHIFQEFSLGGASRSMIAISKYSSQLGDFEHSIISLKKSKKDAFSIIENLNIQVIDTENLDKINYEITKADIVHFHFWNDPILYKILQSELPPMRLLIWFHIAGDGLPHIITDKLVDFADISIPCNPYSFYELPIFKDMSREEREKNIALSYDATDFQRLKGVKLKKHKGFNVGYVGTVNFYKMHKNFVSMNSSINIPNIKFIVCGHGIEDKLKKQAEKLGSSEKFDFKGYVTDIKSAIETFDIYGYPLCKDTYAAAELNLQEVMFAGIPPVVFPYGGLKGLVKDNETGIIVNTELEYKNAIEYLYNNPKERMRLGARAKEYAKKIFGAKNAARKLNPVYEKLMKKDKRKRIWRNNNSLIKDKGSKLFIESLGNNDQKFSDSFYSNNYNTIKEVENEISLSSDLMWNNGIERYNVYYPDNIYLHYWAGLIKFKNEEYNQAENEFIKAIKNGFDELRIFTYLAKITDLKQKFFVSYFFYLILGVDFPKDFKKNLRKMFKISDLFIILKFIINICDNKKIYNISLKILEKIVLEFNIKDNVILNIDLTDIHEILSYNNYLFWQIEKSIKNDCQTIKLKKTLKKKSYFKFLGFFSSKIEEIEIELNILLNLLINIFKNKIYILFYIDNLSILPLINNLQKRFNIKISCLLSWEIIINLNLLKNNYQIILFKIISSNIKNFNLLTESDKINKLLIHNNVNMHLVVKNSEIIKRENTRNIIPKIVYLSFQNDIYGYYFMFKLLSNININVKIEFDIYHPNSFLNEEHKNIYNNYLLLINKKYINHNSNLNNFSQYIKIIQSADYLIIPSSNEIIERYLLWLIDNAYINNIKIIISEDCLKIDKLNDYNNLIFYNNIQSLNKIINNLVIDNKNDVVDMSNIINKDALIEYIF